ncbi:galaxin-like [Erpetoichthys calabaricus]|uniref:galaxin-like n=1 Tax=Erpetoichthys calabaricus TaxID=27687 RepID=UPI002234C70D|nr:galaxin-like [Erpetoichthys calabaricus]
MIYEPVKHLCVNNTIHIKESNGKLGPHIVMCGSNTYFQPRHQTCCVNSSHFGHVQNVTGGRCCAGEAYDPDDKFCCSGKIYSKENWQYIGEDSFLDDAGKFICCNQIKYKISAGEKACHGSIPYNPDNEIVCEDIVHQQNDGICCGKVLYNPLNDICCNGRRYPKSDGGLKPLCCGKKLYDSSNNTLRCCGIQLHEVANGTNVHCCGNILINNGQECCTSESQQRPLMETNNLTCCGHLIYNTTVEKCHAGHLSHRRSHHPTFKTKERCRLVTLDNVYVSEEHKQGVFGKVISIEAKNGERRLILDDYAKLNVSKCPHQISFRFFPQMTENVTIRDNECPSLTVGNTYVFWCPDPGRICEEISPVNLNGKIYISNFLRIGSGPC